MLLLLLKRAEQEVALEVSLDRIEGQDDHLRLVLRHNDTGQQPRLDPRVTAENILDDDGYFKSGLGSDGLMLYHARESRIVVEVVGHQSQLTFYYLIVVVE